MKRIFAVLMCLAILVGVLPGAVSAQDETVKVPVNKDAVLAGLYEADIGSLREAIMEGFITSEELTQYYIARIAQYNAPYNCFITMCEDAMDKAREKDALLKEGKAEGLLFGVPVVIKDNLDLAGYHTTNGYKKKDSQIAQSNAKVVDALLKEGAVIIAKTNMSTGAMRAEYSRSQVAGDTKNAYSKYLSPGGSSGGSAVATSLNFAVASLGTDTNSSLRYPAVLNGCVTLRPTFGLLSNEGIKKLNSKRDTAGAITRTVRDQALMLDVLTEGAYKYTENLDANALNGMRIGILKELTYREQSKADAEIAAAFRNAVEQLKACGAEVVEVSMPKIISTANGTIGNEKSKQEPYRKSFEKMLQDNNVSAVIFPTYLSTPLRLGKDENGKNWDVFSQTYISNTKIVSPSAGVPELALPIGYHSLGAGIGMEIAGASGSEQVLLNIAYAFTEHKDLRVAPTDAPNQYAEKSAGTLRQVIDDHYAAVEEAIRLQEERKQEAERLHLEQIAAQKAKLEAQRREQIMIIVWICVATAVLVAVSLAIVIWATRKEKEPVA